MWRVIYVAPSREAAEALRDSLAGEGLRVDLRTTGLVTNGGTGHVALFVPEREAREAQLVLNQLLGRSRFR